MPKRTGGKALIEQLQDDPAYLAVIKKQMMKQMAKPEVRDNYLAMSPILRDLATHGLVLGSLEDLNKISADQYRGIIPLLLSWLPRVENVTIKEVLVRSLAATWARPAALRPLIEEFIRAPKDQMELKWAIGNTLEAIADKTVVDDLLALVQDQKHGRSRQMMVLALGKIGDQRAVDCLIELLGDEEVRTHAIIGLGRLKAQKARSYLEPFVTNKHPYWRNAAKAAIRKIDKAAEKAARMPPRE